MTKQKKLAILPVMSLALTLFICNFMTVVLAITTFVYAIHLRKTLPVIWLFSLMVCLMIGSFSSIALCLVSDFENKISFFELRTLSMILVPTLWLYFISSVFDRWNWLQKRVVAGVIFAPALMNFSMLLLPTTRPLLFSHFAPLVFQNLSILQFKMEKGYSIFYGWSTGLVLASFVLSGVIFFKESGFRRRQILALNFGFVVAIGSFLSTSPLIAWIVSGSFSVVATQAGITYSLIWQRLLNVISLSATPILQSFPDPVLIIDERGHLVSANEQASSFFNLPSNFVGRSLKDVLPDLPLISGEIILMDREKGLRHFHLSFNQVGSDGKSAPGKVLLFRDISEQKEGESRFNQNLEFRNKLLAFFAHDLSGFVESQSALSSALQKNLHHDHQEQVELLLNSAQASQDLVQNMMSWAQGQTTHFQANKKEFEWNSLVRSSIEQLQPRWETKNIQVVFEALPTLLVATGDSEMLASAFRNILNNAVRATPGGKQIHVILENHSQHVQVKIRDQGTGLNEVELARLREATKIFSLDGLSKSQGAGIGLMIVRHFISLHDGSFQIESNLGVGTEVVFTIPFQKPSYHLG